MAGKTRVSVKTKKLRGKAVVRGGAGTATRTVGLLGGILTYAVEAGIIESNPAHGLRKPKDNVRKRRLSEAEYRILGQMLRDAAAHEKYATTVDIIRQIGLTGCRWPFDVNHLFRRRRRHIMADDFESRRRFESGRQICKPAPRIVSVGAAGITTQIRPVSRRRIDAPTAPPRYGFAAGCNNCLHPSCHRIVRISTQEILIVLQIVAIQSCEIGIPRVKITDGLRSDR